MSGAKVSDIASKRLPKSRYAENFADLHAPLSDHEALVESDRCYFCYDAPCMTACPTSIDVPLFIREIQAGHPKSAAKTIFDQNILGGMCARVCQLRLCVSKLVCASTLRVSLLKLAYCNAMPQTKPWRENTLTPEPNHQVKKWLLLAQGLLALPVRTACP